MEYHGTGYIFENQSATTLILYLTLSKSDRKNYVCYEEKLTCDVHTVCWSNQTV